MAWMMLGLIATGSVNLTKWIGYISTDVHIAAAWESSSKEYWYILSTEPSTLQTFREYGLRFTIEENFLDDKSSGFDLESSRLRSAPALSRLCLVMAMTTLFLTAQGLAVVESGYRRRVAPHWSRGSSYLKIGWNWVITALNKNWVFFSNFVIAQLRGNNASRGFKAT
ncbi:hypothetical protein V2H45_21610, partial [Tumidithrix elongata RA019]|nr:hypothetical protein [Tumidithrix elongata RA019]